MKTLYQASNGVEAHMILHMLKQEGITGRVDGEYLQGGIGELPAVGLVRVMVPEQDYAAAKSIVDKWDAAQPVEATAPAPAKASNRSGVFAVGLILGILCTYAFYRTPVSVDGIDHNHDGRLDETWTYAPSGLPIKSEVDRNRDGRNDYVSHFGRNGTIESSTSDDNFDGIFESRTLYRFGNPEVTEMDTDGDGYRDFRTHFVNGVLASAEYIHPATGLSQKTEYFKLGKLIYAETDTDKDGKMDRRTHYNKLGEAVSMEDVQ